MPFARVASFFHQPRLAPTTRPTRGHPGPRQAPGGEACAWWLLVYGGEVFGADTPILASGKPGGCPDEHAFSALLQGTLDEGERRALHEHLDGCGRCSELMDELGRLLASEPGPREEQPARGSEGRGERVGGRYELLRLVGAGGMGAIHEAHDEALGRKVAIKLLRPDLLDPGVRDDCSARLLREARLLAAVHHPNVLAIYDVGIWKDQVFLAIQYVEGTTVRQWIEQEHPSWPRVLDVYLRVGSGLAEAHRLQLVHRDIKPDNILLDPGGRAWLADFGLACAIGAGVQLREAEPTAEQGTIDPYRSAITRSGAVLGTPAYMAPEQHNGLEVDERADQFSFCASLYESLAGRRAFPGESLREVRAAACSGPRPSRPAGGRGKGVPAALWKVLERGMAARPSERFASMNELLTALTGAATRRSVAQRALRALVWTLAIAAGVAVVALGTLVSAAMLLSSPSPSPSPSTSASASASAAPTDAQKKAALLKEVKELNSRCGSDPGQCDPLLSRLKSCCISTSLEGVVQTDVFRAGAQGLVDRFEKVCDTDPSACSIAAYAWTHSFHNSDSPEGEMIPRYMALVERGCERGDFLSCTAVRDVYASGALRKETPRFAIKPSAPKLVALLGAGCNSGNGQICWLLAESLYQSRSLPEDVNRSLHFAEKGCERGHPAACLLAGLSWRALSPERCQEDLRSFHPQIPDNQVLDSSASWNDIVTFCKLAAAFQDDRKAATLWDLGCQKKDEPQPRATATSRKKFSQLSCERRQTLAPSPPTTAR